MTTLQSFKIAQAATLAAQAARAARMGASKATIYPQLNVCLIAHGQKTVEFKRLQSAPLCTEVQLIAYLLQSGYTLQQGHYVASDASHAIIASRGLIAVCYQDNTGKWQIVNDVFNRYLVLRLRAKVAKNPVTVAVSATATATATVSRTITVCENKAAEYMREVAASITPAIAASADNTAASADNTAASADNTIVVTDKGIAFTPIAKTIGGYIAQVFGRFYHVTKSGFKVCFADGVAVHGARGLSRYMSGI